MFILTPANQACQALYLTNIVLCIKFVIECSLVQRCVEVACYNTQKSVNYTFLPLVTVNPIINGCDLTLPFSELY